MNYDSQQGHRDQPQNRTQKQSPSQNATPSYSMQGSYLLNVNIPTKIHFDDVAKISEIYMDTGTRADKLAYTQTDTFDPNKIRGRDIYAKKESSKGDTGHERPQGTNEKVKIDLTKAFFNNPEHHAQRAIQGILESLRYQYELSEEEMAVFENKSLGDDRKAYVYLQYRKNLLLHTKNFN